MILAIPTIDFVLHYHIDWAKEVLSNRWSIGPKMVGFWCIHGIDQALHQATHVTVIWWVAAKEEDATLDQNGICDAKRDRRV